jgi:hypothetical protein
MAVDQTPLEALGKWSAGTVARMGPRIGAADQPTLAAEPSQAMPEQQQQQQETMPQISREQAIEELKARGIPVE